jgi:hypothetical protein
LPARFIVGRTSIMTSSRFEWIALASGAYGSLSMMRKTHRI